MNENMKRIYSNLFKFIIIQIIQIYQIDLFCFYMQCFIKEQWDPGTIFNARSDSFV